MNVCVINGRTYDVHILAIERNYNILYSENTGRTLAPGAPLILDPLGTFYGHKVTFARNKLNVKAFDDLWECVSQPRTTGMSIKMVYNQGTISYLAYASNGTQKIQRILPNDTVLWDTMEINFIPIEAQVKV